MACNRLLVLALFATVLVAAVSAATPNPKNVIVGTRIPGDHLLQREFVKVPSKILQVVKSKNTFPGDNRSNISQVRLLDQSKNGHGAKATVVNGGPGISYVTVEFKSERGHSIDFIVELYGR